MRRFIYILVTFLVTVGIPFAVLNLSLFKNISATDSLAYMAGLMLITNAVIIGIFQYHFGVIQEQQKTLVDSQQKVNEDFQEGINHLYLTIQGMNEISVYTVDRDLVYDRLKHLIQEAKYKVDLMYFGTEPPSSYLKSINKDTYVEALDEIIIGKTKNIRRIMLYTAQNKNWIKTLVDKHKDNERFSLSIITNKQNLPLVSAQMIDNNIAVLMNLDRSVTPGKPRDIVIESKKVCSVIESYFQEMYRLSIPILTNGRINQANYQKYL